MDDVIHDSAHGAYPMASRIMASFTDLALVVDREGAIADVSVGDEFDAHRSWGALEGRVLHDLVSPESRDKLKRLLKESLDSHTSRSRELNLRVDGLGEIPLRLMGARIDDERALILGIDLRAVAEMQQQMVSAQQTMELEYERVRQAEAHYRVLFHVSTEGVLLAKGPRYLIVEANPAVASMIENTPSALRGKPLEELFDPESQRVLTAMLDSTKAGRPVEVTLRPRDPAMAEVRASASLFRQSGTLMLLLRLRSLDAASTSSARDVQMLELIEDMPDAFVVTGPDLRILSVNASFYELVQQATEGQVLGESLERWLGRPGVDLNIIVSSLRDQGRVRNFSTVIRGNFGSEQGATVAAIAALDGKVPCFGFSIRTTASRATGRSSQNFQTRSAEQLQDLVGRVSLKEIVQETSDLIERLCIEVALETSSNNRAAAAQILGLSRQSLYMKLKRHGLEEFQPS